MADRDPEYSALVRASYTAARSRRAAFAAGHDSAKPDRPLSGNYSPPKEQWTQEALRTVEDERERRLRE